MKIPILSPEELSVLQNKDFMPLKFSAASKLEQRLGGLHQLLKAEVAASANKIPEPIRRNHGKQSRGENYRTYAYRVLDYPAALEKPDIFLFRAMVLWGHHFSFHLMLRGKFKPQFQDRIIKAAYSLPEGLRFQIREDPWTWELENYLPAADIPDFDQNIRKMPYLKAGSFYPLDRYMEMADLGVQSWRQWAGLLFDS
jgi:hypothetical protein